MASAVGKVLAVALGVVVLVVVVAVVVAGALAVVVAAEVLCVSFELLPQPASAAATSNAGSHRRLGRQDPAA